jgi:hypothetical protein
VKTIGTVLVASIAARMATSLAPAQMTATLRLTSEERVHELSGAAG